MSVMWQRFVGYLCDEKREPLSGELFAKALAAFTLLKTVLVWSVSGHLLQAGTMSLPRSYLGKLLLFPSFFANHYPGIFFPLTCGLLALLIWLKPRYITNFLLFWIALNLFRLKYPVTNGSDYVIIIMTLLAIPLAGHRFRDENLNVLTVGAFNVSRILLQFQVVLIYMISGWDKLQSEVWSSGAAFLYIARLDTVPGDWLPKLISQDWVSFVLSWTTILFELCFGILIIKKRTRFLTLCAGVIFHVVIWVMLSLPDFALIMIITYLIFLKHEDILIIKSLFKRRLP